IKDCRAAVDNARQQLGWCTIRAPFAGQVSAPNYTIGAYVGGEGSPVTVATIVNDSLVRANFSVTDNRFMQLTETPEGKRIRLDSVPVTFGDTIAKTYYGNFNYSGLEVDQATGTIRMRLDIDNRARELRQGMYCSVHLPVAVEPHALLVLDAAIGTDQLGKYVYLVNDSNKVVYTPIEVGELYRDSLRVVSKGLTPADRYVTRALLKVRDGMEVRPVEAGAGQSSPTASTNK
ncbi:MAG: efflux RND transporter periplasmic adaptor subunit, partial [Muribaculaceae bacterium]|nr:efflux RND transporter periplasmic adaptor subunit [Muribaculaceae bacterium]